MAKKQPTALQTVKTFNDLARRAADKGAETLGLLWKAGQIAKQAKERLPHGEWMPFVEQFYDVNHKTVTTWIRFHEKVPESKLGVVPNLTAGIKMLDPPKAAPSADDLDTQEPENIHEEEDAAYPQSGEDGWTEPDGSDAQETTPATPRSGTAKRGGSSSVPRKLDRSAWYKQWDQTIGPIVRLVDRMGHGVDEHNGPEQRRVENALHEATSAVMEWMGVEA